MSDNPLLNSKDFEDKELLGLEVIEEATIKCGDCGAPLVDIVVAETNESRVARGQKPLQSQYIINCWRCTGKSFQTKVFSGSTSIKPAKDYVDLDEVDTDIGEGGVIFTILQSRKR